MGEILLRNLQPGATYHLTSMLNLPLTLNYEGDNPVTLNIDPSLPDANEGKVGFESIPDLNWIKVDPSSFDIYSTTVIHSNITLSLPEDESIRGKKYIVYLWSKTSGKEGALGVGVGVKSRVLLTVAKEKESSGESLGGNSYLSFKVEPGSTTIEKVKPGKRIRVGKRAKRSLRVINTGDKEMEFNIQVISGDSLGLPAPQGTVWGPPETEFKIHPTNLKIKAWEKKEFKVDFKIPEEPQHYGKNYQYFLRVTPQGSGITSGIIFRLRVKTVEK